MITKQAKELKTKKVFLGGTCNNSTWRDTIIPKLTINYFNPVVDDWTEAAQKQEIKERKDCDYVLYVITPRMTGVYSIAEVVDDSNKRPNKTIFCYLKYDSEPGRGKTFMFDKSQCKSLDMVGKMVETNGGTWLESLDDVVKYLNS